ncbi:MAG: MFS transporter [Candidatus Caldarchaeum sp.]|nr:MFS transporter [Candidatus Caldarchaeum sp.]
MSRRNKAFIWFSIFSAMLTAQMIMPVIGLYSTVVLGADPFTVGLVYGSAAVTAFAFRIPAALVSGRIGQKKAMVSGLGATSLGYVVYGFASTADHMILGSLVRGLGSAFFFPAALTTVYEESSNGRGGAKSLGYMLTGPAMGMAVGPAVGAVSLAVAGYRPTFFAAAFLSLAGLATVSMSRSHEAENGNASFADLKNPRFTLLLASRFLINYVTGTVAAFLPLMANNVLGYDEPLILILFAAAAVTNLLSRIIMGSVSEKMGAANYVALGSFMVSASAAFFIFGDEALTWAGMLLYGYGMGIFVLGSIYVGGMIVQPAARTLGFAMMTLMIDLGSSVGNFFSGLLLTLGGFTEVFAVTAAVGFAGCAIDLVSRRIPLPVETRRQSSPA